MSDDIFPLTEEEFADRLAEGDHYGHLCIQLFDQETHIDICGAQCNGRLTMEVIDIVCKVFREILLDMLARDNATLN